MADLFKINITADDIASESKEYEPLPTGFYVCAVTGVEIKEVQNGPNAGKHYLQTELTVQEGEFENRKLWNNLMLFNMPKGNWAITQFLKACEIQVEEGEISIPSAEFFMGKVVTARVVRKKDTYKTNRDGMRADGTAWYKNEVAGFNTSEDAPVAPKRRSKRSVLP